MLAAWQATVVDESGNIQSGASVEVLLESSGATAALFSDRDGLSPISNPVTVGSDGFVRFYAAGNSFRINATLGAFTRTWRHVPVGLLGELDTLVSNLLKYDRTTAEIAEAVTPSFYFYIPSPKIDPRRYGVVGDGVTVDTTAMQTAINMAYEQGGRVLIPHDMEILSGALSLTLTGNRLNQSFVIEGAGMNGSRIKQTGTPTALLTLQSSAPTTTHTDAQVILEGFSLEGNSKTCHGLTLSSIADFVLRDVLITEFDRALNCSSSLVGWIENCRLVDSNYGFIARKNGTAPHCNAITIQNSIVKFNSSTGIDFDQGSLLRVVGCDIEANGTASDTNTGAIFIRGNVDAETGFGYALVELDGCWLEVNNGGGLIVVSPQTASLFLSLKNTKIVSTDAGRAIVVSAANSVRIDNCMSPSTGDTWDITSTQATVTNSIVNVLTMTGVASPVCLNTRTGSVDHFNGYRTTFTGSLTGCTTVPTGTITAHMQGDEVTLEWPDILGTSNTTAATITGMPAALRPPANVSIGGVSVQDNGVEVQSLITIGSDGTITLTNGNGGAFTASGGKGVRAGQVRYRV